MELIFQSDPENISLVEKFLIDLGEEYHFSDDTMNSLMIAITEAANNAILHGNKSNPEKKVKLNSSLTDNLLVISISDEGKGFDPGKVPDPLAPENLLKTNGRGVFLMKEIMKSVDYRFTQEGTTVTLTFEVS